MRATSLASALSVSLLSVLATSCGAAATAPGDRAIAPATAARPRLVVLVVYDQLASWVLALHHDSLAPEGAVRFLEDDGLHVERARYAYAGTLTAPGHTAIVSGAPPWQSGVSANRVWDLDRAARVSSFDDGVHPILGHDGAFAGLATLRTRVVADELFDASGGRARIVALGMKDRAVLPPGGHHPTLSLWFDPLAGGFTTTSELRVSLPPWVESFRSERPWQGELRVWEPLRAYDELGPDDQPGEGGYGFDATFPHDAAGLSNTDAFLSLPSSSAYLLALADRAVREEHLGEDDVTDFLSISIAGTDYVGHEFGPESWEARDHLVRVDAMVGSFLRSLAQRTEIAVVLTADHGVAPLPERARAHHLPESARRWSSSEELPLLRQHLNDTLGAREDGWIAGWVVPYITFTREVRSDPQLRARAVEATRNHLRLRPGMGWAFDRLEAPTLRESEDETLRAIGLSIDAEASGDVYVLPSEGSVADDDADTGTAHGSPFVYDRDVPVLVRGPGVSHGRVTEPVAQARVAATLAHLLGVPAPHPGERPLIRP